MFAFSQLARHSRGIVASLFNFLMNLLRQSKALLTGRDKIYKKRCLIKVIYVQKNRRCSDIEFRGAPQSIGERPESKQFIDTCCLCIDWSKPVVWNNSNTIGANFWQHYVIINFAGSFLQISECFTINISFIKSLSYIFSQIY